MERDVLANNDIWLSEGSLAEGGNWKEAIGMITPSVCSPPSTFHHHSTPSSTRLPVIVPPFLSSLLTFAQQTPVFQNYIPFWLRHGQSSRSIDTRELIRRWKKEERTSEGSRPPTIYPHYTMDTFIAFVLSRVHSFTNPPPIDIYYSQVTAPAKHPTSWPPTTIHPHRVAQSKQGEHYLVWWEATGCSRWIRCSFFSFAKSSSGSTTQRRRCHSPGGLERDYAKGEVNSITTNIQ